VWTKAKYQKEKNKINICKTDSNISKNTKRVIKKPINFDDIPVGGRMNGMERVGGGADFNVEIRIPPQKNQYYQNKNGNYENNKKNEKEIYLKKLLEKKK
jgi:hypothetical protein